MALNAYLRLTGAKQGDIRGSVTQKGREGRILVIAASHEFASPRDVASGQASGRRQHTPLVITKELDRASPLLQAALVSNETITSLTLDFFSASRLGGGPAGGAGVEVNTYSISLANASIASMRLVMPNVRDPELAKRETYEEIAFTYQKITWTWHDGGIAATDDWQAPVT
jgi:type VI secretion system secreted protein Hcp